jgi:hypothetical protein
MQTDKDMQAGTSTLRQRLRIDIIVIMVEIDPAARRHWSLPEDQSWVLSEPIVSTRNS